MFEHFGLKDVFVGLWKYKWKMFFESLILAGIVSLLAYKFPLQVEEPDIEVGESSELQCARADFYLDYTGTDSQISSKVLNTLYADTIKKTACQRFIADKILGKYEKAKIVELYGYNITEEQITTSWFSQFVTVGKTADDIGMYLLVRTPDMQFSKDVLCIYMEWMENLSKMQNSKVDVVPIAESEEVILLNTENTQTLVEKQQWSIEKIVILSFICCMFLSCIGVFIICLFKPVLNRKSDFEELGLNVIAEIWGNRGE